MEDYNQSKFLILNQIESLLCLHSWCAKLHIHLSISLCLTISAIILLNPFPISTNLINNMLPINIPCNHTIFTITKEHICITLPLNIEAYECYRKI